MTQGKCRDCQQLTAVAVGDWNRASRPRCGACGGTLDRLNAPVQRRRTASNARAPQRSARHTHIEDDES